MLTALGFLTIATVLGLLLSGRVTAVVALVGVPVVAAFVAGFSATEIGEFATAGLEGIVGTAAMFVFAILFFGVLRDAGMFDPIVRRALAFAGTNPVTVALATAVIAGACHLDGAGATTFLITIPAMLPLYDALGMSRLTLTTVTGLSAGVMNLVPWGGPTARAAATVKVDANDIWVPLIPAQVAGIVCVLGVAYLLGRREKVRLATGTPAPVAAVSAGAGLGAPGGGAGTGGAGAGPTPDDGATSRPDDGPEAEGEFSMSDPSLLRPRLYWVNVAVAVATVGVLIWGVMPPELVFMAAVVVALALNYPGLSTQTARINAHAQGAVLMASTLLAAGVFLGVMEESGMIEHMARALTDAVPTGVGSGLVVAVGAVGVPASLVFGPDPYYFGVLPVLTSLGSGLGVAPLDLAQASVLGEETVGFPISPLTGSFYLLTGLAGVPIGAHIRSLLPWAWLVSLVMLAVALLTGALPLPG
jgi:citrate-Mg2+:H+ or citrate-Ca2+:H+ symporter, CitMHS family